MSEPNGRPAGSTAGSPEQLLAQVALGNRAAFESLYHATADKLFGICVRVLGERAGPRTPCRRYSATCGARPRSSMPAKRAP